MFRTNYYLDSGKASFAAFYESADCKRCNDHDVVTWVALVALASLASLVGNYHNRIVGRAQDGFVVHHSAYIPHRCFALALQLVAKAFGTAVLVLAAMGLVFAQMLVVELV